MARLPKDITKVLARISEGDRSASAELLPVVYEQLRRIAQQKMAAERPGHTLQATALVHEVYLKLLGDKEISWNDRAHFLNAAAGAMQRILVDHARKRGRLRHGGGRKRALLDVADLAAEENPSEILALDEALRRLEGQDERMSQVVKLRFFAGLSIEETSRVLDVSPRTVKREWTCARAWLYKELAGDGS